MLKVTWITFLQHILSLCIFSLKNRNAIGEMPCERKVLSKKSWRKGPSSLGHWTETADSTLSVRSSNGITDITRDFLGEDTVRVTDDAAPPQANCKLTKGNQPAAKACSHHCQGVHLQARQGLGRVLMGCSLRGECIVPLPGTCSELCWG